MMNARRPQDHYDCEYQRACADQLDPYSANPHENESLARAVVLEIFFDDMQPPAVSVPLGIFMLTAPGAPLTSPRPSWKKELEA